jgi:hypothetical protein
MSAFNGTDEGKKLFINAVKYLRGETIDNGDNGNNGGGGGTSVKTLAKNSLNLFPNPASQYILLSNLKTITSYKIFNVNGAIVLKGKTSNRIDVSTLPAGLYMIVTDSGLSGKFLKQ